jgi:glycosyltransferase involved in cell wall biosynthesis
MKSNLKKLLMIAPIYPFPAECGLSIRIGDMCKNISDTVELHLYVCGTCPNSRGIKCNSIFHTVQFSPLKSKDSLFESIKKKVKHRILRPYFDDKLYIPDYILDDLSSLYKKHAFEAVMIHTPVPARCLTAFPDNVYKIVDSIDIFIQRYLDFCKIGQGEILYHFRDVEKEMQLYKSADLAIAISLWDRDFMISHGISPIYVPVSFKPEPLPVKYPFETDILYAAGSGPTNIDAIHFFIKEIFPIVKKSEPKARFLMLNPCEALKNAYTNHDGIIMLPYVEQMRDAYKLADVVVVPLRAGSGLKIKVLESFAFGKPTILSTSAVQGIPVQRYAQRNITSDPAGLAVELLEALKDRDYRSELVASGLDIISREYNPDKVYRELKMRLSSL